MIDKETIKALKEQRPETKLFLGELSFNDEQGDPDGIEFIFRQPKIADMENYAKKSSTSVVSANLNLLTSLVVHPDPKTVKERLESSPNVVGSFINQRIMPFFGDLQVAEVTPI